jgi:hypothetical protein
VTGAWHDHTTRVPPLCVCDVPRWRSSWMGCIHVSASGVLQPWLRLVTPTVLCSCLGAWVGRQINDLDAILGGGQAAVKVDSCQGGSASDGGTEQVSTLPVEANPVAVEQVLV